jgi:PPK2 family polyphosphate:nucleotide phosphotransferase
MIAKRVSKILDRFCVTAGKGFRLKDLDPADTAGLDIEKDHAADLLQQGVERLSELQDMLYAQDRWSVLCMFQAMDAAGKDGAIKHVFSGVNPQGCQVHSYKAPNAMELDHDFLWRHSTALPERGRIGIHNRSWYEEVLVVRVHPDYLGGQKLPQRMIGKHIWDERIEDIAAYERYLARQGTVVLKFFLNVSKGEQKRRFLSRIDEPEKNWKFSAADVAERAYWDDYMAAYEEAIRGTAAKHAPWYVVPADNKWFTRLVVVAAIVQALEKLELHYPRVTKAQKATLEVARKALV